MSEVQFFKTAGFAVAAAVAGYLCTALFWPWDQSNPFLKSLIKALTVFLKISVYSIHMNYLKVNGLGIAKYSLVFCSKMALYHSAGFL